MENDQLDVIYIFGFNYVSLCLLIFIFFIEIYRLKTKRDVVGDFELANISGITES